jgi:hypothetical protein
MIISLIENYFSNSTQYHNTLLIRSKEGSNRFQHNFDWSYLSVEHHFLPVSERTYNYNSELNQLLDQVLKREYSHYVTFLEHTALNYYLTGQLSKRDVKICLAPEGTRPYISINKTALFSRLRFTFENYRFLTSQRLAWNHFQIISNKHGFLREISEIWIEYPEMYPNLNNRKIVQIDLFRNLSAIETAQRFFGFNPEKELPTSKNIIFYINHWFVINDLYFYELKIVKLIRKRYPDRPLLIKLHPNTPKFQVKAFKSLPDVTIIESTLPAELFILSISKSKIYSFWSAALMINNPVNEFFWMHSLLRADNPKMSWWDINNPTKHIYEVKTIKEI